MGVVLTNHDAEALLLDIRTGLAAHGARIRRRSGAFLVFPTSVVIERSDRGQLVYPVRVDVEPGSLCHDDGSARVSAIVDGIEVSGSFAWVLARDASLRRVPDAVYRFRKRGRDVPAPEWADQLPASLRLTRRTPALLTRDRRRLMRRGRLAEYWLLRLTLRFCERSCAGPFRRAIEARTHVDMDDVAQRGLIVATRLLPLYASPERPPCSWIRMLQLDARRDMFREIGRLDWLPQELGEVRSRARAMGIESCRDPEAILDLLVESAAVAGVPAPRVTASGVARAFATPRLVSLDVHDLYDLAVPDRDDIGDMARPGAVPGVVAAAVARLVSQQPELTALAFLGDSVALNTVAAIAVRALRRAGETGAAARRRCRHEFLTSGRLFSSGIGSRRFASLATEDGLAAIDAALGALIGLQLPAPAQTTSN